MKAVSFEELEKALNAPSACKAFLIYGDNGFFKRKAMNAVISHALGDDISEFSLIKFDDRNMDFEEITASCLTAPLMCSHKCVCVTDPPLAQMSESDIELLTGVIEDTPEFTTLILYCIAGDFDVKKAKTAKIAEQFAKFGCEVCFSNKGLKNSARDFAVSTVKSMGCSISNADAYTIVEKANGDFERMYNEITKLCAYKPGGVITAEDIENMFSVYLSSTVFELTKFIFAGNYEGALKKLNLLKMQKEEPVAILSELSSGFLDYYRAVLGRNHKKDADAVKADFGYKSSVSFRVDNAFRGAYKYRDVFLERCIDLLVKADIELKSSGTDKYTVLEQLITNIFIAKEETVS